MTRKFKTANYEKTLELQISLRDVLPPEHLARVKKRAVFTRHVRLDVYQSAARGGLIKREIKG